MVTTAPRPLQGSNAFVAALFRHGCAFALYSASPTNVMNREAVKMLVNAVLPHLEPHMNTIEQAGYYPLLEELEERLLSELQRMLSGDEVDVASLNRAAEIVRRSRDVLRSVQRESMHVDDGGDESPTKAT
ncbi:hypothetical protein LIP_0986 [Limnochorda pilosa]|uniref:Uncharacterized protein n=1 Tax=Limnochorda pilosa TaxID=1555112 RepID=A0A0K2SIA9_LIMPI|nr:hypothetical protein LIP_0986 [Limnochorda pilosa]